MPLSLRDIRISLPWAPLAALPRLDIANGEVVTLMGASGSGKSTLLSFIGGDLEPPFIANGEVLLDGTDVSQWAPERRRIGRLFQDDLLFPHLTVAENLLFGCPRGDRDARRAAVKQALADAELEGFGDRAPHTLSGGQRARVALMRALLAAPRAMLLDEPFNRLDSELREQMRVFVFGHVRAKGIPCLLVTHDRADAPDGSRVLRLTGGEVKDD